VDHTGVPNATLVKENAKIAELYKQKSVAEQNSVDLAWDMLMDPKYAALQQILYTSAAELDRFRQLVVNVSRTTPPPFFSIWGVFDSSLVYLITNKTWIVHCLDGNGDWYCGQGPEKP